MPAYRQCKVCGASVEREHYARHKLAHRREPPRKSRLMRVCPHCKSVLPAAEYEQHRARCYTLHRKDGRPQHSSSSAWKKLRAQVVARDGHRCRRCGSSRDLQVAHLSHDWRQDDPAQLITLCVRCHKAFDAAYARGDMFAL